MAKKNQKKNSYMFTNKNHPLKGIMSTILGAISILSIFLAIYLTYENKGEALLQYGTSLFLTTLFSMVGLGLGIASRMEKDKYYLFSYLGIFINFLAVCAISLILFAGAYGL
ncbi:MAG TPA: DUF6142 family protein [Lachnospiraceae bacterium]|nr:DUF6142 family protein [Lachnospiraceae bacterium]